MDRARTPWPTIGVVAGFKTSDAALSSFLEQAFPCIKIAQYRIPAPFWVSWLRKRVKEIGFFPLIGHLALSVYLRTQRQLEKAIGDSIWSKAGCFRPRWASIRSSRRACFSERELAEFLENVDALVLLDATRLSRDFFRKFKKPIVQVLWGATPRYYGDSGAFWAYACGDLSGVGVTLASRGAAFDTLSILEEVPVAASPQEDLRTLKVKQVLALRDALPRALAKAMSGEAPGDFQKVFCRLFRAPTLLTYARFLKNRSLACFPAYAFKETVGKISR